MRRGHHDLQSTDGRLRYDISDNLTSVHCRPRPSKYDDSSSRNIETTNPNIGFSYDFTRNPDVAAIDYDIDVTNPQNFVVAGDGLLQKNLVDRTNDTARLDLDWYFRTGHSFRFGGIFNDREVDSQIFQQSATPPGVPLSSMSRVFEFEDVGGYGSGTSCAFRLEFPRARTLRFRLGIKPFRGRPRHWVVTERTAAPTGNNLRRC